MRIVFAIPLWLSFALNGQSPAYLIDTVAGSGWTGDGGPATLAILRQPGGVTADSFGNVFIAETGGHRVRKLDRSGAITTVVGTGVAGFSGDGAPAIAAQLAFPYGLATDLFGNLYIADLGNARVRRVTADGNISTIAGGGSLDPTLNQIPAGPGMLATSVRLAAPRNLLADDSGSLYISDFGGHRVFQLSSAGVLSTLLGTGVRGYSGDGGLAADAQLAYPAGLASGFDGSLYLADSLNHAVRRVSSGVVTTFASVGTPVGLALDVFGTLQVADLAGGLLRFPVVGAIPPLNVPASDVVRASDFSLFVPDSAGGLVRRVSLRGEITIAAGGGDPARGDGGAATEALLNRPSGVAADAAGNLYVADRDNHRVRRVGVDGIISTVGGAVWSAPSGVSVDVAGNIYVVDAGLREVVRIRPGGTLERVAPGLALTAPVSAVADARENLYIADAGAGTIFRVDSAGTASALLDQLAGPSGLALDDAGHLFFSEQDGARVRRLDLVSGDISDLGAGAWNIPRGIALSTSGEIFVADTGRQQIMRIDSVGQVTAIAGLAGAAASTAIPGFSGDGAAATAAQLNFPWDVAIGPGGVLYVADLENHRVRRLNPQLVPPPVPVTKTLEVLNGASLVPGPVAPGMLLVIRGSGIPATDAVNTIVLINSIPVPILAMDDAQIQVQAPFTLATPAEAEIVIVDNGSIVATIIVPTAAAAPALFPVDPQAAAATAGTIVTFYGTGLGLGDLPVTATIGGAAAEVMSLDPSPGYAGLFLIKIRVPAAAAAGKADVVVMVGGAASQAGVNIAIAP